MKENKTKKVSDESEREEGRRRRSREAWIIGCISSGWQTTTQENIEKEPRGKLAEDVGGERGIFASARGVSGGGCCEVRERERFRQRC